MSGTAENGPRPGAPSADRLRSSGNPELPPMSPNGMRPFRGSEVEQYFADLPNRAHGAIIYDEDSVRYPLMFGFLKAGLERNWLCVFATMDDSPEPVSQQMREYGLDPDRADGSLAVRTGRSLFGPGKEPDFKLWLHNIDTFFAEAHRKNKVGIRWAGELPNHFLRTGQLDKWFRMEEAFDERAPNYAILCAYDSRLTFDRSVVEVVQHYKELPLERRRLTDLHSFVVFTADKNTHRILDNAPGGVHPVFPTYPRSPMPSFPS
jgi:hypothetical protein